MIKDWIHPVSIEHAKDRAEARRHRESRESARAEGRKAGLLEAADYVQMLADYTGGKLNGEEVARRLRAKTEEG